MNPKTEYTNKSVLKADQYGKIDGRNAYQSDLESLSLGVSPKEARQRTQNILIHTLERAEEGYKNATIPVHRAIDMTILLCQSQLYFQDAYRLPKLYDPENPTVKNIGLQGDALRIEVCKENLMIDEQIQQFYQALGENGELLGERLRVLARLLEDLGYKK
ncbi:hypothetical protein HHO41_15475 [Bacillus sp. DNRA2]|uniref:DUF6530 family protein n=1 Tax=Bacillus sp. DNRA2 TaxID=2723053 RepID=UPI00145EFD2C|nr:DUF6530 family protein [Bacillus sp. DNRA2]NMD71700.1 hypothetical protein [Bacillus sp. DNRA2]